MLRIQQIIRPLHTSRVWMSDTKNLLSTLRKKTGYPLTNCKKALEACDYDVAKAQVWLKEQALALGWAKAFKLSDRSALQGLIAVTGDKKSASMVEVNCETDFVARNAIFQMLAANVANACFSLAKEQTEFQDSIAKVDLDTPQLRNMISSEGRKLEDEVAIAVSQLGENIQLRRATCVNLGADLLVSVGTHPVVAERESVIMGQYGSLLVYKTKEDTEDTEVIAKNLCQHIIGMKPSKIGEMKEDEPKENLDSESCLIYQPFVMDREVTVSKMLKQKEISLVGFSRFACGEDLDDTVGDVVQHPEPIQSVA